LQITEHGLSIPSVPETGPPVLPPQPINHGPPPVLDVDVEPVDPPRLAATAFPPPGYYPPPAPPTREPFRAIDRDEDDAPPPRRRSPFGNVLLDFLLLRRHIAPTLIVAVFWLGTAFLVVSGLVTVVGSFNATKGVSLSGLDLGGLNADDPGLGGGLSLPSVKSERGFSFPMFLSGVFLLFAGPIVLRVMCEFVIVVFRINESLLAVKDRLGRDRP
jgi:hypothetical protein